MLTTIQELEREIDQFHKNVKDSNELLKILKTVATLTKSQTESFESRTRTLQEELANLPPELSDIFKRKIEGFIQEVHDEDQDYRNAVSKIMELYADKISAAEKAISKIPGQIDALATAAHKKYIEELNSVELAHAKSMTSTLDGYTRQINAASEAIGKVPSLLDAQNEVSHKKYIEELVAVETAHVKRLDESIAQHTTKLNSATESILNIPVTVGEQMQNDRVHNIEALKQIQDQYASDLAKINDAYSKQLKNVTERIEVLPEQLKNNEIQLYGQFVKELEKLMDARMAQLAQTEKHIVQLSNQLDTKYDAFVAKLEATNVDRLYKYCHDLNKSLNAKLGLVLGGVVVAIIVSIVSLFI